MLLALAMALLGVLAGLLLARFWAREAGAQARATRERAETLSTRAAELAADNGRLAAILEHMVEAVVAVDTRGRVLAVNPALCRLFGVEEAAALGRPFLEALRHSRLNQRIEALLADWRAHPEGTVEEVQLFTPEERAFEVHAVPIRSGDACSGALLVLHDITRLRRLEQHRRDFVANVSHELRTPIASIQATAETLASGGLPAASAAEFLSAIEEDARRMGRLVEDLLELAAIESGRRSPRLETLSVLDPVREAAAGLRQLAERRRVRIEIAELELPPVPGDRGQLRQVFSNLLDNAVKFSRDGGRVLVSAAVTGKRLAVSVSDDGLGIPASDLPRVFERFFRVDKARSRDAGGTGLGLAIVKHLVEAHGGEVSAESAEGRGSTFRVSLPLA